MAASDALFAGSIPELYDALMVPMIFEPYAADLARRAAALAPRQVLEVAAGTGAVTRMLARGLPGAEIVATDLNPAMLQRAQAIGTAHPVRWQAADAMQLPFEHASFDAVVCQFGAMFFPDKPTAYREMHRVLRPGGVLLFNVWDSLAHNEFAAIVTGALAELFPDDPPRFMARTPHGYFERDVIVRDLAAGGFAKPQIEVVASRSHAPSAHAAAMGYCQGTPMRAEIEARGSLEQATAVSIAALEQRFGGGPIDGKIQALVMTVRA